MVCFFSRISRSGLGREAGGGAMQTAVDSLQKQQKRRAKPRGAPFRKGESGNLAGRPAGSRNRATMIAEQLLDCEVRALTRKAVEMALGGDAAAMRLCLSRIIGARNVRRLDALLCAYIRDAIVRAGIDPACAWGLREIEARLAEFVDTPELQAADAAFKAADEEPFCWAGPRDQLQTKLDRIGQYFL